MDALPPELDAEREALLREIDAAFDGVSREGSPSWSEAEYADTLFESSPQRVFARTRDDETKWQELPANAVWAGEIYQGAGAWGFLDSRAYRYYLPAALVVCLKSGEGNGFDDLLALPSLPTETKSHSDSSERSYRLDQWSMLDDRQRHCVCRFLLLMRDIERWIEREDERMSPDRWAEAVQSYWGRDAKGVSRYP